MTSMTGYNGVHSTALEVRVEDYINDKIQTSADFENIDALLLGLEEQQALLKKQVRCSNTYNVQTLG